MTHATDLIGLGPRRTAFDILRAPYGELWVTDLEASSRFYVDLSGLSSVPAPTTRCTSGAGRSDPSLARAP